MLIFSHLNWRSLFVYFLLCKLLFSGSFAVQAETQLHVVTEEWPPFNYTDKNGQIVGRSTMVVEQLLRSANISYQIHSYPWVRALQRAKKVPNTMIYSIFQTPERVDQFKWLCPLIESPKIFLFRLASRNDLADLTLTQLSEHTVAVIKNDVADDFLRHNTQVHVDSSSLGVTNFRKLIAGRVDYMASTEFTMIENIKAQGLNDKIVVPEIAIAAATPKPLCMAFNLETDDTLIAKIATQMTKLKHQ
ncbi:substrate-binding periplasmic protein [Pseudoalteromonas tunicata]|uniref:Putative ABC transporter, periplasmic substrate-binding protein n=1 Tax=Pseudoalteromonas tunicata D2 TaxID=87626 RepID=A4CE67_9GAMM|nr:transporter substrate-binding domain-containing protein [Pseudoalteromonas tunicata]ATC93085.1 hypothetical protein PTUN_a0268 [Pseudoalteromonas tunicata]EAR26879.1 putative ABC transporter, periplasmic substrate-binding protein [Pseudoalteromonas tunicata D2]MDP5213600.1 transporter substrate-binding domain-containing protein [Pseudoalteromonas tunicata]